MFIVYEHNGEHCMGELLNEQGEIVEFDTEDTAEKFAKENCAFEYKIVKI